MARHLFLAIVLVVLATAAWHPHAVPEWFTHQDKLHHVIGFAIGAVALRLSLSRLFLVEHALLLLLAAVSVEFIQSYVPGRMPSMLDLAASLAGAALGMYAHHRFEGVAMRTCASDA